GGQTSDKAEDSLNLEALSALCTNLSNRVLALETGRKNAKSGPTKDDSAKLDTELDEDMEYMDTKEALNEGRQSTVDIVRPDVSTARQELKMTLTDTLIKSKDDKAKDKRKGVLEEFESAKKMTKSDFDAAQIARDEEIAR
nr:hypothetical protein [Tanacetum cinerariifolium]